MIPILPDRNRVRPKPKSEAPRCREDWCGGLMELERALLVCIACHSTRPATPDEARRCLLAWSEVVA